MKNKIYYLLTISILLWGCADSLISTEQEGISKLKRGAPACKTIANAKVKATSTIMEIEVLESNSDFHNYIYLVSPGPSTLLAIDDETGRVVTLPPTRKNQELIFEIRINDGAPMWQSGPGSRNSDGQRHAQVEKCGNQYEVRFEDIDASGWGIADEPNFVDAIFIVRPK